MASTENRRKPFFAWIYPRLAASADKQGGEEHRRDLLAGLQGRVIEVGAGDGRNFRHYPETVTEVVAVEPEPKLRELAEVRARKAAVKIEVVPGLAHKLPADDDAFDAGVVSLVLCTFSDVAGALAELRRVLRPGGELRFYEHVRAWTPGLAAVQTVLDPLWTRIAGGCHLNRDTVAAVEAAGFEITGVERFHFRPALVASPHVIGTAIRRT